MKRNEPSRKWQEHQHRLVVQANATAFAELCEIALPHLTQFLRRQYPTYDNSDHDETAIDTLLAYHSRPQKFDPGKLSLFAYLRMAARRDFLNKIDRHNRHNRRLLDIDNPAIQSIMPNQQSLEENFVVDAWLSQHTSLSQEEFIDALNSLLDATDQKVFSLLLDGVRETEVYAEVMGLDGENIQVQQQEVKRAKDRVIKKLQRSGPRLKNDTLS